MHTKSQLLSLAPLAAIALAACFPTETQAAEAENSAPQTATQNNHSFLDPIESFATDSILRPTAPFQLLPGKDPNGWSFVIEPYVWAMAINGKTGVGSLPAMSVNQDAINVIRHLDWAIFAKGEVRKGRWGVLGDGYYAALSASGDLGGNLYKEGSLQMQQALASLALSYRIIDDRRGFLDLYAGARYNYLGIQVDLTSDQAGIQDLSTGITNRVAQRIDQQVSAAVQAVRAEVLAAVQVAKQSIDSQVANDVNSLPARITNDVRARVDTRALEAVAEDARTRRDRRSLRDLADRGLRQRGISERSDRELRRAGITPRRADPLRGFYSDLRTIDEIETVRDGHRRQRTRGALVEYLRAAVDLEIAKVRGEVTGDLEKRANAAKAKASKELAADIGEALPTSGAGDQWWIDPIIGLRGQLNITRWLFLAGQGDVGGFGVGSQITWNTQATIGFNFTRNIFAELGYRYMYVDYNKNNFLYQMNSFGLFSSIGVKF